MKRVEGKVAIVTGAGSGIGEGTAKLLADEGARVVVADINAGGAERVTKEIEAAGGDAVGITVDVSGEDDVERMIRIAVDTWGRLDILHNNAALTSPEYQGADTTVTEMSVELWDDVMAVNLRGPMLGCKHAVPVMIESGGGSIVNMSSGSAALGDLARTAYAASKSGVNALTLYVATQYGRQNIRCNSILPGLILTPAAAANVPADVKRMFAADVLVPRFGEPIDIAALVLFLGTDEGRMITGQLLHVNGGQASHQPHYGPAVGPFEVS